MGELLQALDQVRVTAIAAPQREVRTLTPGA